MTTFNSDRASQWPSGLTKALIANLVWINASEVLRYFAVLRAMMKSTFPQIPEIAPMNVPVFLSWGVWDTLLLFAATGFSWLYLERFGNNLRNAVVAGTIVWLSIFVILWLGLFNMNLATPSIVAAMLPWAWVEMVVAALIVRKFQDR
jgi:hypothetical protein